MFDNEKLLNYIQRVERLEEEKSNIQSDIREVFIEAESEGFDPKAIKYVIKCRKMSPEELAETDAINETYRKAINL